MRSRPTYSLKVWPVSLPPQAGVDALRITVTATNGLDHARICEVRAYEGDAPVWSTGPA